MRITRSCPLSSVNSIVALQRERVSRGSVEVHVAQSHAMTGMPAEVPVPRNRKRMGKDREGEAIGNGQ